MDNVETLGCSSGPVPKTEHRARSAEFPLDTQTILNLAISYNLGASSDRILARSSSKSIPNSARILGIASSIVEFSEIQHSVLQNPLVFPLRWELYFRHRLMQE